MHPPSEYERACHEQRRAELEGNRRKVAYAFEEQVGKVLNEMEMLSCMLAGSGFPEGAMQLDKGARTAFEEMAPWITYRVIEKLHRVQEGGMP